MAGRKEEAYYNEAERLYVKENQTPEQIAGMLPVCANTVYAWSKKGGWGRKREASQAGPRTMAEKMRRNLERQIEALEGEDRIDAGAYDAIYKAFCVIDKLERAQDLRVIGVAVMQEFTAWLKGQEISAGELQMVGGRIREWFRSLE